MTQTAVRDQGVWRGPLWVGNALVGLLAVLSPIAAFVAIRIGLVRSCTGIDLLGLPWHPAVSTIVMMIAALIVAASFASLIVGYRTRGMRGVAAAATVYGVVSILPVMFFLFLSVYGDPGPTCNPV
jgi:hypothetical protein